MMRSNTRRLLLLLATACACTDDLPLDSRRYEDEGSVCLSPRGAGGSHVQVLINDCESACAELEAACSASLVDGTLLLVSTAVASEERDHICTDECQPVEVACTLPELPDGNYELRYGGRVATVSMPVPIAGTLVLAAPDVEPDGDPCESLPLLP
jgi:hypothetical protein